MSPFVSSPLFPYLFTSGWSLSVFYSHVYTPPIPASVCTAVSGSSQGRKSEGLGPLEASGECLGFPVQAEQLSGGLVVALCSFCTADCRFLFYPLRYVQ